MQFVPMGEILYNMWTGDSNAQQEKWTHVGM